MPCWFRVFCVELLGLASFKPSQLSVMLGCADATGNFCWCWGWALLQLPNALSLLEFMLDGLLTAVKFCVEAGSSAVNPWLSGCALDDPLPEKNWLLTGVFESAKIVEVEIVYYSKLAHRISHHLNSQKWASESLQQQPNCPQAPAHEPGSHVGLVVHPSDRMLDNEALKESSSAHVIPSSGGMGRVLCSTVADSDSEPAEAKVGLKGTQVEDGDASHCPVVDGGTSYCAPVDPRVSKSLQQQPNCPQAPAHEPGSQVGLVVHPSDRMLDAEALKESSSAHVIPSSCGMGRVLCSTAADSDSVPTEAEVGLKGTQVEDGDASHCPVVDRGTSYCAPVDPGGAHQNLDYPISRKYSLVDSGHIVPINVSPGDLLIGEQFGKDQVGFQVDLNSASSASCLAADPKAIVVDQMHSLECCPAIESAQSHVDSTAEQPYHADYTTQTNRMEMEKASQHRQLQELLFINKVQQQISPTSGAAVHQQSSAAKICSLQHSTSKKGQQLSHPNKVNSVAIPNNNQCNISPSAVIKKAAFAGAQQISSQPIPPQQGHKAYNSSSAPAT
ncbi:hypothetical protein Nepgr_024707 [Nepenthes gracilis]|uniref:Uncharacterized protein n=1 Tax=Nepenthes gracilis TaxID=150966 RepID=A0AAD3T5M4_NEPGR|nr:hypothetical protein Nepgr_024707 [Nepenthes gracilis]